MARIEIEEPQTAPVIASHALLRIALGGVVLLQVAARAIRYTAWRERVVGLGIGTARLDASVIARASLLVAALLGICLILGLLTRLAALGVIGAATAALALLLPNANMLFNPTFELACLMIAGALYLFTNGAGTFSLDTARRRRARRRAIEHDAIWNSAPYSEPPASSRSR